jgi:sugar-specific transcriptional regulator TrmB
MQNHLKILGIDDKDYAVFLKLLELGAQPVSVLAKHVGLPRSSTYVVLERLRSLELIEEFERQGMRYVQCVPAQNLPGLIRAHEARYQQARQEIEADLTQLEALENRLSITPRVKFHEGKEEILKVYDDVLQADSFLAFFNPKVIRERMPDYIVQAANALGNHTGIAREILVHSEVAKAYQAQFHSASHEVRILPKSRQFDVDIIILREKLYMISYGQNEVSATEIHNADLITFQRNLFEQTWDSLKA